MTLGSELFLSPNSFAPQGGGRNAVATERASPRNDYGKGDVNSSQASQDGFGDYLARETNTENPVTNPITDQVSAPGTGQIENDPSDAQQASTNGFSQQIAVMAGENPSGLNKAGRAEENNYQADTSGRALDEKNSPGQFNRPEQLVPAIEKISDRMIQGQNITGPANGKGDNTAIRPENAISLNQATNASVRDSNPSQPNGPAITSSARIEKTEVGEFSVKPVTDQPVTDQKGPAQNIVTQGHEDVTEPEKRQEKGPENLSQNADNKTAGAKPQADIIQGQKIDPYIAGTAVQSPAHISSENNKTTRDITGKSVKAAGTEMNVTPGEGKGTAPADQGGNAERGSKNTTEGQYTPQNALRNTPQNTTGTIKDTSATGNNPASSQSSILTQNTIMPKAPFLTELTQLMTGTDSKAAQLGTVNLQGGILSVQEAGQSSSLTTAASHIKPALLPAPPQMLTNQISMAIMKQAANGQDSFRLSLKPAELGQVNIRMDFQADGKMAATIIVDNERTLSLLQRDQNTLSKILENAGFDVAGNGLNFSLKKHQQDQSHPEFTDHNGAGGDNDDLLGPLDNIISQQQMKMAYSDNILDINI